MIKKGQELRVLLPPPPLDVTDSQAVRAVQMIQYIMLIVNAVISAQNGDVRQWVSLLIHTKAENHGNHISRSHG